MNIFILFVICVIFSISTFARPDEKLSKAKHSKSLPSQEKSYVTSRRKNIIHKKPYGDANLSVELFRETLSRHLDKDDAAGDPCRYMRCRPGEQCEVEEGRAKCICKRHCKQRHNPICGTDDEYYENHCEMHRHACMSGRDTYDARHKDCFYKASECSGWELKRYQEMMMQFYRNVLSSAESRHRAKEDKKTERNISRRKRSADKAQQRKEVKKQRNEKSEEIQKYSNTLETDTSDVSTPKNEFDISTNQTSMSILTPTSTSDVSTISSDVITPQIPATKRTALKDSFELMDAIQAKLELGSKNEEIMTKDTTGDMVKYVFALMDLDSNGKVGSDEIWEITSLQHLDNVLPGPCSLFHVLKYGDTNNDRTLDISEAFTLFNVSVFRLRKEDRYVSIPVIYGNHAQLQCGIEGETKPVWHRYGREVQEKNGAKVKGRMLYLNDITTKNAGNYTCSARTKQNMTQTIDLQIMISPQVEVHPRAQHPSLQSSATVKCHAEGRPRPSIRWTRNGQPLDLHSGKYVMMANNTELHFNLVGEQDAAAYSCVAENVAGIGEDVGAIYVESNSVHQENSVLSPVYFVFHQYGISIVNPHTCQTTRNIRSDQKIPGLLMQDTLCGIVDSDSRECTWSESVLVGFRFIYATQPNNDRIVVVDKQLQRVVEIITTDLMPVQLYYVASTDQVFVICWVDEDRTESLIQVVHSAGVAGAHFAEHVKPLAKSGHRVYDRSVYDMFIPPESPFNPSSKHGFVIHKNESVVHRLDFSSLTYGNPIDLSAHQCTPVRINYLPIGGILHISCLSNEDKQTLHEISIDIVTEAEVQLKKGTGVTQEFFSYDYNFAIKLRPRHDMITVHNISISGELHEFMIVRTNFKVADVFFARKKNKPEAMVAYMIAKNQGDVMYVDLEKKKVQIINGLTAPATPDAWPWRDRTRRLTSSGWFGWFLATAGRTGLEILGLNSNQVLCRMDEFVHVTAVSWSGEEI